jgi:ankyrin repeat protein
MKYEDWKDDPDALISAAQCGKFELAKRFIADGVDVNYQDEDGNTALIAVIEEGYGDVKMVTSS